MLASRRPVKNPPLDAIYEQAIVNISEQAKGVAKHYRSQSWVPPPAIVYDGIAGVVSELALHPDLSTITTEIAQLLVDATDGMVIPPSLLYGRMGICLALRTAERDGNSRGLTDVPAQRLLPRTNEMDSEVRVDFSHGLAGVGSGYLDYAFGSTTHEEEGFALANLCALRLLRSEEMITEQLGALPVGNQAYGISVADGFAHGRAGIAHFLLAHAIRTGNGDSYNRARSLVDRLAVVAPVLAERAHSRLARPMAASWCQGLAGIGSTLLRSALVFGEERHLDAAERSAEGCLAIAPRMPVVGQCCGLAGVGDFLLDMAVGTRDNAYREAAFHILDLMMMRGGHLLAGPNIQRASVVQGQMGWASGDSGVLAFLRRLAFPLSRRLWISDVEHFRIHSIS